MKCEIVAEVLVYIVVLQTIHTTHKQCLVYHNEGVWNLVSIWNKLTDQYSFTINTKDMYTQNNCTTYLSKAEHVLAIATVCDPTHYYTFFIPMHIPI